MLSLVDYLGSFIIRSAEQMNVNHIYGNLSQYHAYQNSDNSFQNFGQRRLSGVESVQSRHQSQMDSHPTAGIKSAAIADYSPNLNLSRPANQQNILNLSRTIINQQRTLNLHDSQVSGGIETEPALSKPEGFNYFRKAKAQASPIKSSTPVLFGHGYPPRVPTTQNTTDPALASTPNLHFDGTKPANSYLQLDSRQPRPVSVTLASNRQPGLSPAPALLQPAAAGLSASILSNSQLHSSQLSHTPTRVARYSPLLQKYDDERSKSPSVISHLNTNINEELRSKLGIDAETERLESDFEHLVSENERKVQNFVETLQKRIAAIPDPQIGKLIEESEKINLDIDAQFFAEKAKIYDDWVARVRKQIEDRELIYRSIYKLANNPKSLETFLGKKQAEIEADNRREKNHYERKIEILEAELKGIEQEIARADAAQKECDEEWVKQEHSQRIAWEAKAREQMNERGYDLVVRYFQHYGKEDPQCNKLASQMAELARHRKEYKEKLEEARLLADPAKLEQEIIRMENELRRRRM